MKVRVAGTWRSGTPHVKVGGTWRPVKTGYVRVAGVWRPFYQQPTGNITPGTKYTGTMVPGQMTASNGVVSRGYYEANYGSMNPTAVGSASIWYVNAGSDSNGTVILLGNNTTLKSIRFDDKPAMSLGTGTYDSKLNWTTYSIADASGFTKAQLYTYLGTKLGTAVALNMD